MKTDASADKSMILAPGERMESIGNSPRRQRGNGHHRRYLYQHRSSWSILNRSQYLAGLKDLSFKPEEIVNSDTSVYLYGDVAIATSVYRTKGTDSGKPFVHRGRFTDTWIKRTGEWKCIADQETLIH
jgi:hypothetical protein